MRTLGNIIWNIPFLGFVTAALVFLIGLLFVVTIIAAPIGLGLIQYSKFLLLPFSYDMVSKSEIDGDANKNILWQTYGFILKAVYVIFLGIRWSYSLWYRLSAVFAALSVFRLPL
ncbi:YccF domain-containing protein [Parasutterella sp.]|uniref:YccF domain-containing protein n=1 Tax=Parasutterella sp. TaxID=2049037 RepID=UPI003AB802C1